MLRFSFRSLLAVCAVAMAFVMFAAEADARARISAGSRGTRTFTPPSATQTAPTPARPMERTMTQPANPGAATAARPTPASQPGGLFNRPGLMGGLLAGFLGAGLFGLLLGHGFMGGLAGLASLLGLVLQVGLVVIVAMLAWRWWQRRNQPAYASASEPSLRDIQSGERPRMGLGALGGLGGGSAAAAPQGGDEIGTTPADFDVFERLLGEVQTAYGNEDLGRLRAHVTPEMLSYFSDELSANASRGVVNRISDVKLLQGDLSEAWREGNAEYASVAMRYGINDQTVERASGRVVDGGPQEATEVWTFMRARGGDWVLSAIQQV